MDAGKAISKMTAILTALPPPLRAGAVRLVLDSVGLTLALLYPEASPLADAVRARRYRDRHRHATVTPVRDESVTKRVTNITPKRDETRDESVTNSVTNRDATPPYPPGFTSFWATYPKQKRVGKAKCFRLWNKQKLEQKAGVVVAGLKRNLGYILRENGKYIPNPETFLNQERWDDEVEAPKSQAQRLWDEAQAEKQGPGPA